MRPAWKTNKKETKYKGWKKDKEGHSKILDFNFSRLKVKKEIIKENKQEN